MQKRDSKMDANFIVSGITIKFSSDAIPLIEEEYAVTDITLY